MASTPCVITVLDAAELAVSLAYWSAVILLLALSNAACARTLAEFALEYAEPANVFTAIMFVFWVASTPCVYTVLDEALFATL